MSVSTYLEFALLSVGQADKETWMNEAISGMGAAFAATYALNASTISGAGQSLTLTYNATTDISDRSALRFLFLSITGTPTNDFNVIHPAKHHFFIVKNATSKAATVKTPSGSGIAVPAGEQYSLYCDGTNVIRITLADGATSILGLDDVPDSFGTEGQILAINSTEDGMEWVDPPDVADIALIDLIDVEGYTGNAGKVLTVNETEDGAEWTAVDNKFTMMMCFMGLLPNDDDLVRLVFDRDVDFADDLPTSHCDAAAASTGTAVLTLKKNGVSFGTITFTSSATGVIATTAATSFADGDVFTVTPPLSQDATLAGVSFTMVGSKG